MPPPHPPWSLSRSIPPPYASSENTTIGVKLDEFLSLHTSVAEIEIVRRPCKGISICLHVSSAPSSRSAYLRPYSVQTLPMPRPSISGLIPIPPPPSRPCWPWPLSIGTVSWECKNASPHLLPLFISDVTDGTLLSPPYPHILHPPIKIVLVPPVPLPPYLPISIFGILPIGLSPASSEYPPQFLRPISRQMRTILPDPNRAMSMMHQTPGGEGCSHRIHRHPCPCGAPLSSSSNLSTTDTPLCLLCSWPHPVASSSIPFLFLLLLLLLRLLIPYPPPYRHSPPSSFSSAEIFSNP